jgi:hypothetical protein
MTGFIHCKEYSCGHEQTLSPAMKIQILFRHVSIEANYDLLKPICAYDDLTRIIHEELSQLACSLFPQHIFKSVKISRYSREFEKALRNQLTAPFINTLMNNPG